MYNEKKRKEKKRGWVRVVQAIIFDLDDTLLWDKKSVATAFQKTCDYAATVYQIDAIKLENSVRAEATQLYSTYDTYEFTRNIGINPFEALWGQFDDEGKEFQHMKTLVPDYRVNSWTKGLLRNGIDNSTGGFELAERFRTERRKSPFVYEETFAVLDHLKGNYKLILLTNGSPSLQYEKLNITPELEGFFDHIIISGDFGKGKPAVEIFEHVLEVAKINVKDILMVGDNLHTDILGASRIGMRSVWVNREQHVNTTQISPTYEIDNLRKLVALIEEKNDKS